MKKIILILILFSAFAVFGEDVRKGVLTVTIKNLRSDGGTVRVTLFNSKDGYPSKVEKALTKVFLKISNKTATAQFKDLPFGTYAIGVFHDENGNGKVDTNFIGMPTEGFGASNDAKGSFGPPSFQDASFKMEWIKKTLVINAVYP